MYDLKTLIIENVRYSYFYKREKNDVNGNPRYRVWAIDPGNSAVYEKIVKCYESQIPEYIEKVVLK